MDKEKCLFFINEDQVADHLKKTVLSNHCSDKRLGYRVIKDGYVLISRKWTKQHFLEGGVVDAQFHYLPETGYVDIGGCAYEFDASKVDLAGRCVFLGTFHTNYGHAITDALKKLWFLNTEEGEKLILDRSVDLVYITAQNVDMPQWHLRILELAGIDVGRLRQVRTITKYKEIIIPDNSLLVENRMLCFTNAYREMIEKIKAKVRCTSCYLSTPSLDLYFTRTAVPGISTKEVGEKAIETLFSKQGFRVFSPEKLSIEEQISLLMKCSRFASTEGACSHAGLFCESADQIIVLRKANYVNYYSTMITDLVGCQNVFVDVHHSVKADQTAYGPLSLAMLGPFYLYVTRHLARFFGLKMFIVPLFFRPSYLNYRFAIKDNCHRAALALCCRIKALKSLVLRR